MDSDFDSDLEPSNKSPSKQQKKLNFDHEISDDVISANEVSDEPKSELGSDDAANDKVISAKEIENMDWESIAKQAATEIRLEDAGEDLRNQIPPKKSFPKELKEELKANLEDLRTKTEGLSFIDTLTVSTAEFPIDDADQFAGGYSRPKHIDRLANSDIKREIYFYQSTLTAVKGALTLLKEEPGGEDMIQRPNDFYAEMIKTDDHMRKVKGRIVWEQKRMGIVEARRKNRRLKKFHKEQMSQKQQEAQKDRRLGRDQLDQWKRSSNRDARSLQQILKDARVHYEAQKKHKLKKKPNMRKIIKDLKYGKRPYKIAGISSRNKKRNTHATSNNWMEDFKRSHQRDIVHSGKGRGRGRGSRGNGRGGDRGRSRGGGRGRGGGGRGRGGRGRGQRF